MNVERMTNPRVDARVTKYAALADPVRLAVVDHLVIGDASPSELQALLGIASNLLAHHLKVLEDAGIAHRRRSQGDGRRNYVSLAPGGLDALGPPSPRVDQHADPTRRVVFVCTANSARSQLATALWRDASDIPVASAGTQPAARIAPGARAAAKRHGLRLVNDTPTHLDDVLRDDDLVITVCDNAHEELAGRDAVHWAIADPVAVNTTAAYDDAVIDLSRRIITLAAVTSADSTSIGN